jgi:hypothetical protein
MEGTALMSPLVLGSESLSCAAGPVGIPMLSKRFLLPERTCSESG